MSKEGKTLKVVSLLLLVLSLVVLGACVHEALTAVGILVLILTLLLGIMGLVAGWGGIQGANKPSVAASNKVKAIILMVVAVVIPVLMQAGAMRLDVHGLQSLGILAVLAFIAGLLEYIYSNKVSEQVSL